MAITILLALAGFLAVVVTAFGDWGGSPRKKFALVFGIILAAASAVGIIIEKANDKSSFDKLNAELLGARTYLTQAAEELAKLKVDAENAVREREQIQQRLVVSQSSLEAAQEERLILLDALSDSNSQLTQTRQDIDVLRSESASLAATMDDTNSRVRGQEAALQAADPVYNDQGIRLGEDGEPMCVQFTKREIHKETSNLNGLTSTSEWYEYRTNWSCETRGGTVTFESDPNDRANGSLPNTGFSFGDQ